MQNEHLLVHDVCTVDHMNDYCDRPDPPNPPNPPVKQVEWNCRICGCCTASCKIQCLAVFVHVTSAVCCSGLKCFEVDHSTLQCAAVCCIVL